MGTMTGARCAALRKRLGLDPFAFAAALGVAVSTVYRWESPAPKTSKKRRDVDPLHDQILNALGKRKTRELADLGKRIRVVLLDGKGTLGALREVLDLICEAPKR